MDGFEAVILVLIALLGVMQLTLWRLQEKADELRLDVSELHALLTDIALEGWDEDDLHTPLLERTNGASHE